MNDSTAPALVGEILDRMPAPLVQAPTANPYPVLIEKILDKGGDLSSLDKMLDLQIRWEAHEAEKAYVAAMAAFKAEPMVIEKRKLVEFETRDGDITSYRHAELSDVTAVVVPAMAKHGLSHRWDVKQEGGGITVTCITTHARGHSESVSMTAAPDASGKKNAIQQVASTTTYLQRYTLLASTGMATTGMDDDGRGSEPPGDVDPGSIDPNASWLDAIAAAVDETGLKAIKADMVKTFGDQRPTVVVRAYNKRLDEVRPAEGQS